MGRRDTGKLSLEDYFFESYQTHREAPVGVERFVIDFWPRTKAQAMPR